LAASVPIWGRQHLPSLKRPVRPEATSDSEHYYTIAMAWLQAAAVALSLYATGALGLAPTGAEPDSADGGPEMRKLGAVDSRRLAKVVDGKVVDGKVVDGADGAVNEDSDIWPFTRKIPANSRNITVFLNGEPKSGTTWLEYIAKDLITEGCAREAGCQLVSEDTDDRTMGQRTTATAVSAHRTSGLLRYDVKDKHRVPNVGHFNSLDFTIAPNMTDADVEAAAKSTLEGAAQGAKWLAVFRDPRDVAISMCYHSVKDCPDASGHTLVRINRVAQWINLRHRFFDALHKLAPERVMTLYYEDMKSDERGAIRQLARLFEVPVSRRQVRLISERTTFSAMKEMPRIAQKGAVSGMVREGGSCMYDKQLSAEAAKQVTEKMRRALSPELNAIWKC